MCDDFEDDDAERDILEKNWKKSIDGINKDGYRAGIDVGQEESLQDGFNTTFKLASKLLFSVAEIRGLVSGKLSYNLMKPGSLSPDQEQHLQELLSEIVQYETKLLTFSNQLYSDLLHKQKSSCNNGGDINQSAVNVCAAENVTCYSLSDSSAFENTKTDSILEKKLTEELNNKLEIPAEITDASKLPDTELKINLFKRTYESILMPGV